VLSTLYYIGNYATKLETPIYQRVALMAMVVADEAQVVRTKTAKTFMHRVFNKICTDRELSAVEVCAHLLDHKFDYSSVSEKGWVWVHPGTLYWCIVRRWRLLRRAINNGNNQDEEDSEQTDQLILTSAGAKPTVFSAYLSRGADLRPLCFYDYVSLIKSEKKKADKNASYSACFDFDTSSLKCFTQRIRSTKDICVPLFSTALAKTDIESTPKYW
jgi:hypothetical protein